MVHGVNLGAAGLQFTIMDNTGGIGVFSPSAQFGYTVTEGDSVEVQGTVGHFRGLAQVSNLDTVVLITANQALQTPDVVTALNESTESDLIKILNLTLVDPAQWTGTGSGFDVDVTDGTNTYLMRIDNDVDLYSLPAPVGAFNLTGIGGQFSSPNAIPYDNGYQILPRYQQDIEFITGLAGNETKGWSVSVFPNPANDVVTIRLSTNAEAQAILYDLQGRQLWSRAIKSQAKVEVTELPAGLYIVKIIADNQVQTTKLIVK